jgi:hypothetical protein
VAANRWQGVAGDLAGATGRMPSKGERAGAPQKGGLIERGEVLWLEGDKGVRGLIEETGGSGRRSPTNGRR